MLVYISLDQPTNYFHERCQRVCFILTDTVYQRVHQLDELLVFLF